MKQPTAEAVNGHHQGVATDQTEVEWEAGSITWAPTLGCRLVRM